MIRNLFLSLALVLFSFTNLFAAPFDDYDPRLDRYDGRKLYNAAKITGSSEAAFDLGMLYSKAIKDYDKAIQWFSISYKSDNAAIKASSANNLGYAYSEKNNAQEAIKWYMIAIERGIQLAKYDLAIVYQDMLKDYPNAIKWYEISYKEDKDNEAAHALGSLYENKLGDYKNAIKWYKIAALKGNIGSVNNLGILFYKRYNDKITAGAYYLGMIGYHSKKEILDFLKSDWNLTNDDLKKAYELHQTLDLPKHYKGGID
jgi:TPR repeat protein